MFKSCPGVFVEDSNDENLINVLLAGNLNRKYKIRAVEEIEADKEQKPQLMETQQNQIDTPKSEEFELQTNTNGKENKPQLTDLTNLNNSSQTNGQNLQTNKADTILNTETSVKCEEQFKPDYSKLSFNCKKFDRNHVFENL